MHLSSVDIIHGTPILDIKPYIPDFDTAADEDVKLPWWIRNSPVPLLTVKFDKTAEEQLAALQNSFGFFSR